MKSDYDGQLVGGRSFMRFLQIELAGFSIGSGILRDISETFATRIVLIVLGVATSVVVTRILGPEGRGLYAVTATITSITIQFGNLGLHASNTYFVARNRSLLPILVANSLFVGSCFGAFCAFLAWAFFALWPQLSLVSGRLLIVGLASVPFGLVYLLLQNLLLGIRETRAFNAIELSTKVAGLLLIGMVLAFRLVDVLSLLISALIAVAIGTALTVFRLRRHAHLSFRPSLPQLKMNLQYGTKAYIVAFFSFMVIRIDILLVRHLLGPEQAGFYSVATAMGDAVYLLPVVCGIILFPRLSAMTGGRERFRLFRKGAVLVGSVTALMAIILVPLGHVAVKFLYGRTFLPSVPAFLWLLPGIVALSINTTCMNYFASTGMPLVTVYSAGAATLLNVILNLYLIPLHGIVGASLASVFAYWLMLLISLGFILRQSRTGNEL